MRDVLYSIGAVARFAGVSVRTLHHYDDIGLLSPSGRTPAGYRQYSDADLERLQRVLCYRELGFELDKVAAILDDPDIDPVEHLRQQHGLLINRIDRLRQMVEAVERILEARRMGISLTPDEIFEVFGDDDPTRHAQEAEERWGETDAYRESHRRTSAYSKSDWLRIKAHGEDIERRLAVALEAGAAPTSAAVLALAEEHRGHIGQNFYDCSHEMHCALAEMYLSDPRFTAHYEEIAEGLARFLHDAIVANAERAGSR